MTGRFAFAAALALACLPADAASLKDAVIRALETNPLVQAETQNRNAVDQGLREARSGYLPQLDIVAGYGPEWTNDFRTRAAPGSETQQLDRREASVRLTQRLFDGFATGSSVDSRKALVRAAGHRVFATAEEIAVETAKVYLEVLRQRQTLRLADDLVRIHVRTLESLRARRRSGVGTTADIYQTEVRLERARALRLISRRNLRDAEARYLRVVGEAPERPSQPAPPENLPTGIEAAVSAVGQNNPRGLVHNELVRSSDADVEHAAAEFYPRVNIEADAGYEEDVDGIDDYKKSGRVMLRLRWNLYKGGADVARHRKARARLLEAQNRQRDVREDAEQRVRQAWNAYEAAGERIARLKRAVEFSVRTRNAYRQQFRVAQRSLLDVLDAESELFTSRVQLLAAETNRSVAGYRMLGLQGKVLETLGVPRPASARPKAEPFLGSSE